MQRRTKPNPENSAKRKPFRGGDFFSAQLELEREVIAGAQHRSYPSAIIGWSATAVIPIRKKGRPWEKTSRPQSPETKRYVPPGTTAGHFGDAELDTTSEAESMQKCGSSRLSTNASPPETPTAELQKSRSVSPSSTTPKHS